MVPQLLWQELQRRVPFTLCLHGYNNEKKNKKRISLIRPRLFSLDKPYFYFFFFCGFFTSSSDSEEDEVDDELSADESLLSSDELDDSSLSSDDDDSSSVVVGSFFFFVCFAGFSSFSFFTEPALDPSLASEERLVLVSLADLLTSTAAFLELPLPRLPPFLLPSLSPFFSSLFLRLMDLEESLLEETLSLGDALELFLGDSLPLGDTSSFLLTGSDALLPPASAS